MKTQPADHVIAFAVGSCIIVVISLLALIASVAGASSLLYIAGGVLAAYVLGWAILGLVFRRRGLL